MLPVILTNGKGIESEELSQFNNESIAGLRLTERILLILASEGFDRVQLVTDIPDLRFKRLNKKFPNFKIVQSKGLIDLDKNTELLVFQNNIVLNKKQLQSALEAIKNNDESIIIGEQNNSGIIFIKNYNSP